jgi:hypothetical protein
MKNFIQVKFQYKEQPNATLSKFFKTQEEVAQFKSNNPSYIFIGENK